MDMKRFHKEVESMQFKLKNYLDEPNHPKAKSIEQQFQKLEDEVQVGKGSHSIRARLKQIESQLKPAYNAGVMSHGHYDDLEDWVRDCLQKIR